MPAPFFIICGHGCMSNDDIRTECPEAGIMPLLVIEMHGETIMPCFANAKIASKFVRWNLPKEWAWGVVNLRKCDVEKIEAAGTVVKKFSEVPYYKTNATFNVEVLECDSEEVEILIN